MKNTFEIEKTKDGYQVTIKAGRGKFAAAVVNGELTLQIDKELAAIVSKALYTPKKKPFNKGFAPLKSAEERYDSETLVKDKTHKEVPMPPADRVIPEGVTPKKSHSAKKDK